ncbi:hypothetical protein ATO11_13400 [Pseudaestuariivita atlantica]|uniref:Membrane fusion protein biotin-lipoyl like domain-containing protein n=2 Tax=Pseudaestuariivita atlantica TaxID=1317121 RepID=A0A0L1JNS5_9RHOB|nr:hypothetical protein ATO11_13400 [Pseudaestuariivita atlantica]
MILWLAFGLSLTAILWFALASTLASTRIDRSILLDVAWSHPEAAPRPLDLPMGLPFGTLLVTEGDIVEPGQPVMVFDQTHLANQRVIIERRLLTTRLERRCLLDGGETPPVWTGPNPGIDDETRDQLDAARLRCTARFDAIRSTETPIDAAIGLLGRRVDALDRKLALTFNADASVDPRARAAAALAVTLDRNRALTRQARAEERLATLRATHAAELSARIATLTASVDAQSLILDTLTRFEDTPSLSSPHGGTIARVRSRAPGAVAQTDVTYAIVVPEGAGEPELRAPIDPAIAATLRADTEIDVVFRPSIHAELQSARARIAAIRQPDKAGDPATLVLALDIAETEPYFTQPIIESAILPRTSEPVLTDLLARLVDSRLFRLVDAAGLPRGEDLPAI